MAQIRPYESQVSSQGGMPSQNASPNDAGGPGLTNLGQAVETLGQNMGHVQRIVQNNATRAAVTDVHTMLAGARAEYTKQALEFETKADPQDTDMWEQFYHGGRNPDEPSEGTMKWYLDSYRDKIQDPTAQQAFDRGAADLTAQFGIHFAQMQGRMAGVHAKNQAIKLLDHAQTTVQTDPSLYPQVLNQTMAAISDPSTDYGRLSAEQREPIKRQAIEQISKSAMQGLINVAPEQALHQLNTNTHGMGLKGEDVETLVRSAETHVAAKGVQARQAAVELERQKKLKSEATETTLMAQWGLHMANPKNPSVKAMDVVEAMKPENGLDPTVGRTILNMIDENARRGPRPQHTNPVVEHELFRRIHLPDSDPKKIVDTAQIYESYLKGSLSDSTRNDLVKELTDARSPDGSVFGREKADFLKGIEPQITKPGPFGIYSDPTTPEKFATYKRELEAKIAQYRKEGKDPRALLDENSKDYFGRVAKSSKYQSTGFGSVASKSTGPAPAAPRKSLEEIFGIK